MTRDCTAAPAAGTTLGPSIMMGGKIGLRVGFQSPFCAPRSYHALVRPRRVPGTRSLTSCAMAAVVSAAETAEYWPACLLDPAGWPEHEWSDLAAARAVN